METVNRCVMEGADEQRQPEVQARSLRNKLISLTLDWELAALTLDAQRYKTQTTLERESLRDSAVIYRKCIAEVSELITAVSLMACRQKY